MELDASAIADTMSNYSGFSSGVWSLPALDLWTIDSTLLPFRFSGNTL